MKKLNLGIVGGGARGLWVLGHEFVRRINDVRVLAICDPRDGLKEDVAWVKSDVVENIGPVDYDIATVKTLDEFLAIKGMDAVFVATPDHLHAEQVERILPAGLDMLLEKPLATNVEDLKRMTAAQVLAKRRIFVGFCMRYNLLHARVKELLSSGAIGRPTGISFQDYFCLGRGYFRSNGRFRKFTGGLLTEKACHSFDLMNWFLDAKPVDIAAFGEVQVFKPNPKAAMHCKDCTLTKECPDFVEIRRKDVYGQSEMKGRRAKAPNDLCVYNSEKDNEDTEAVIVRYDTGALATYMECFYSPTSDRRYSIIGDRGEIFASEELGTIRYRRLDAPEWTEEKFVYPPGGHRGSDPAMVTGAIAFLRGEDNDPRAAGLEEGVMSSMMGLTATRAIDEKRILSM